jgi:protein-arginine kinase activator protein McsA
MKTTYIKLKSILYSFFMGTKKHIHICNRCGKNMRIWEINYYNDKTDSYVCNSCAKDVEETKNIEKKKSDFE